MASPSNTPGTYYVTVVEDTDINRVISTATLVTELQFNHRCPMVRMCKQLIKNHQIENWTLH